VDVGLDHRRVEAHPSPLHRFFGAGDIYDAVMDLRDRRWPESQAPPAHRLGIGHLTAADAGEVAIHQIGPHLPFQNLVAPIADMLQHQKAQNHLGRRAGTAVRRALRMPPRQGAVHRRHQMIVRQHPIGVPHPRFAEVGDLCGDQPVAKASLPAAMLDHAFVPSDLAAALSERSRS
jgi:hypothetical protein